MKSVMFWLASTWALGAYLLDRYGARDKGVEAERWDAIIVAGCRVMPDGAASSSLLRRTELAVELWRLGVAPKIVFTGGTGDTLPSEAAASAHHARILGVPWDAMILERWSTSTEENARFARALLDGERVVVVSDRYHLFRCERVFRRYFAEVQGVGSVAKPIPRAVGSIREVTALAYYAATGRL